MCSLRRLMAEWEDAGWVNTETNFADLVGKTLVSVQQDEDKQEILFGTDAGRKFLMYHEQDCCEGVYVESIVGELDWLLGTPILMAEEVTEEGRNLDSDGDDYGSHTWTFYKLATINGYVTIRWYGESNGYYSESVDFVEVIV